MEHTQDVSLIEPAVDPAEDQAAGPTDPLAWQRMFVLRRDPLFMNVGTVGSPPREVLETIREQHREIAERGLSAYHETFTDLRRQIGMGLGCDAGELFISANTTDGIGTVLAGLALNAGDEVLTTNHEHPAADVPLAILRDRRGVVVHRVTLPIGNDQRAEDYVERFEEAITSRTKVMLFSAPVYRTGTMLPIRMLAELAQRHGLITVVDGAHIPGQLALRYRELGVDFLAGSGAKWQCGPERTGLLYIRNKVLPQYNPNPLPEFWPTITSAEFYPEGGTRRRTPTDVAGYGIVDLLQDVGNPSLPQVHGLAKACEIWDDIGRERIERHSLSLATHLKQQIAQRWGLDALYSPLDDSRLRTALTAFNPFADRRDVLDATRTATFVERLLTEHRITVRSTEVPVPGSDLVHHAVRISTHLFHTRDDVDRVLRAAWQLSRTMATRG
ncbi:aminotransferase class V-fold PLP-dependent enzyme [Streptomyces sp. 2A115]|uniref:aminotransferase class V-fold PLP-dependent enzyme n=1 Tax=Streptomyces sp. 2A115 TaxID=3457439 RepID=UPI003FD35979